MGSINYAGTHANGATVSFKSKAEMYTYRTRANKGRGFYQKLIFSLCTMMHFTQNRSLTYSKDKRKSVKHTNFRPI